MIRRRVESRNRITACRVDQEKLDWVFADSKANNRDSLSRSFGTAGFAPDRPSGEGSQIPDGATILRGLPRSVSIVILDDERGKLFESL
jgi:hypothetical protein